MPDAARRHLPPAIYFIVAAYCLFVLIWPGDIPWIEDESQLIWSAFVANHNGQLAIQGLSGSYHFSYGPFPTWIYQGLLLFTHNLFHLSQLHATLLTSITAASLFWIGRNLRLNPWFIPVMMFSPYLWLYSRFLWDNNFCIPLSALLLATYLEWLKSERPAALAAVSLLIGLLPLAHFMALAIVVPVTLHLLLFRRKKLKGYRWLIAALALIPWAVAWRYTASLFHAHAQMMPASVGYNGWWFSLLGPRIFSGWGMEYFFGGGWRADGGWVTETAYWISLVAFPLVWCGMILAAVRIAGTIRHREILDLPGHALVLAFAVFASQTLLDGLARAYGHPHYYNATWIAYALFAWLAVDSLVRVRWMVLVPAVYATALIVLTLSVMLRIHAKGGTRHPDFGPTLAQQSRVAKVIWSYAPQSQIRTNVENFEKTPGSLEVLGWLSDKPAMILPTVKLFVRYRSDDPSDANVEVIQEP